MSEEEVLKEVVASEEVPKEEPKASIQSVELEIQQCLMNVSAKNPISINTAINAIMNTYVMLMLKFVEREKIVEVIRDHMEHICKEIKEGTAFPDPNAKTQCCEPEVLESE